MYVGDGSPDQLYPERVLAERARMKQFADRAKRLASTSSS
jgi:hypothetical protein